MLLVPKYKVGDAVYVAQVIDKQYIRIQGPVNICKRNVYGAISGNDFDVTVQYTINQLNANYLECVLHNSAEEALECARNELERVLGVNQIK